MYLITGVAGFIGFHVCKHFLEHGHKVIGIDNLNEYYDLSLKEGRLALLQVHPNFEFHKITLEDKDSLSIIFDRYKFSCVINLAAQAGVRYSIENPNAYITSNVAGFLNLLELCAQQKINHLIYASSSSVYGNTKIIPFTEAECLDKPESVYAATKKMNELLAYTYSQVHGLCTTGLRFFTVYGPWGRPDMAPMLFADAIVNRKPIKVFNNGNLSRDFTFVEDISAGVFKVATMNPDPQNRYKIFNIGRGAPVSLMEFIDTMEMVIGIKAHKEFLPMQEGDVYSTYACIDELKKHTGFYPKTNLKDGIQIFWNWYSDFYKLNL